MNNIDKLNNFNFFRLFFAIMVIFSHSFALLGKIEPSIWGRSLGNLAVHGFFIISGYLICKSYLSNPKLIKFITNRILRIGPGLIVALFISHNIAHYFDGFKNNYVPFIVNGPIWTLTWEAVCYGGIVILGLFFTLTKHTFPTLFCGALFAYALNANNTSDAFLVIAPLCLMFMTGIFIFIMEDSINLFYSAIGATIILSLISNIYLFNHLADGVRHHIVFLWGPSISNEFIMRILYFTSFPYVLIFLCKKIKPILKFKSDFVLN